MEQYNDIQLKMDPGNSSTARILMKATCETGKATGLSLSTVSVIYIMKYLSTTSRTTGVFKLISNFHSEYKTQ